LPYTIYDNVADLFTILMTALKDDYILNAKITEQLLRLMLFAKLFGIAVHNSGIWQLENIWLEIGKCLMKDISAARESD
jgi:hypothetical protein